MTPQIEIKHNIGNTITVPNQLDVRAETYTGNNTNAGATSLLVDNTTEFTSGSSILLLLSSMGMENAEILASASHTINNFVITATTLNHSRGEVVSQIKYDQIVILKSATLGGSYTTFATQTFQVTQQNTVIYDPAGLDTDYYKLQWKNSLTGALSDLSDPISVLAYPENSVATSIVLPVLMAMGVSKNDPRINSEFLISAVSDARKFMQAKLYGIRQPWQEKFEFPIKVLAGSNFVYLPDDIDFDKTDRSLLAARFLIGNVLTPFNLRYIDKRTWNQVSFQIMGGTLEADISIGATSIQLSSTGDFPPSGVAIVATTAFSQTIMQIEYTGNNLTTNTLTGVTGVIRAVPAGTQVWQNPSIVQPIYYTVYDNKLVFDRILPQSMQGNNVYIDYYKKIDPVVSLDQVLPEHYRESYKWYLKYAIKYRKDINTPNDDPDLKKFEETVLAVFSNMYMGQDTVIVTD